MKIKRIPGTQLFLLYIFIYIYIIQSFTVQIKQFTVGSRSFKLSADWRLHSTRKISKKTTEIKLEN